MKNPAQISAMLRFYLSQLGAQNAHHDFEHLTRHVARARIYSNILPATGPVSAGGDGGRDFETFRTRVPSLPIKGANFAGRSSQDRFAVFACSLNKRIETKIRKDLKVILENRDVDEVVYFCEVDLPIAKRQKLIAEARNLSVDLQIFDGNAIAELLAEPELFWIAEEYLRFPAEITPFVISDDEYVRQRTDWMSRTLLPFNRADFLSIRRGLRQATFDVDKQADLSIWLEKMSGFVSEHAPRELVRSAKYEMAVAHLRGRGDMTNQAELVFDYFSDLEEHTDVENLTDAATLLNYSFGGCYLGRFRVDERDLREIGNKIERTLQNCMEAEPGPGRHAGLLYVKGLVTFSSKGADAGSNLAASIDCWQAMLDCADKAPLYPLEPFADFLVKIVKQVGDDNKLLELASRVDDMLGGRLGAVAAGENAIKRALTFCELEMPTVAIRELQKAKTKWFSGENLVGVIRVLLTLAEQYNLLGLAYAAKYQAMIAAYLSRYDSSGEIAGLETDAILHLLDAEDSAGNSFGFLQLLPVFLTVHCLKDDQPLDLSSHPRLSSQIGQVIAFLGLLERFDPALRNVFEDIIAEWPNEIREPILQAADQPDGFWNAGTLTEIWSEMEVAFIDRPFGDAGSERKVCWDACGLRWVAIFENNYLTTPVAEQLIAQMQSAACALAGYDLGLVPAEVVLKIETAETSEKLTFEFPDESSDAFHIRLPVSDREPEQFGDAIAVVFAILDACSVLEFDEISNRLDVSVIEAVFTGRPYAEVYREFVHENLFAEAARKTASPLNNEQPFNSKAGQRVSWFSGPGPNFEMTRAETDVQFRYDRVLPSLLYTVDRISNDRNVRSRLVRMHEKGMKDWEILSILSNIALGVRLTNLDNLKPEEARQKALAQLEIAETPDNALDPTNFPDHLFTIHSETYLAAFLSSWQLEWPPCAKCKGVEEFLISRYQLRDIDVEHPNIFRWQEENSPTSRDNLS